MKTLPLRRSLLVFSIACIIGCNEPTSVTRGATVVPPVDMNKVRREAAAQLTDLHKRSRLAEWNIRAHTAGPACNILLVEIGIVIDESFIEAMHYGHGSYGVVENGIQYFYLEHGFRGVVYQDKSTKRWSYGELSDAEAQKVAPCP